VLVVGFDTATPAVSVALHDGERVVAEAFAADGRRHGELLMPMIAQVLADAGASRADLTAIAAGVGPGPYTGLRVGVVTARVLGAVLGIPVHGVCSLDVIAAALLAPSFPGGPIPPDPPCSLPGGPIPPDPPCSLPGGPIPPGPPWGRTTPPSPPAATPSPGREFLVATDARRKEVYWARYDAAGRRVQGPLVGSAASIPGAAGLAVAGAGGRLYPEAFGDVTGPAYPDAGTLCGIVTGQLARDGAAPGRSVPLLPAEPLYLRRPDAREPGPPKRVTPPPAHLPIPPSPVHGGAPAPRPPWPSPS
jgi:tRNA threonylcarbamoyladenosine biosynthesis protein TsaB